MYYICGLCVIILNYSIMRKFSLFFLLSFILFIEVQAQSRILKLELQNKTEQTVVDYVVELSEKQLSGLSFGNYIADDGKTQVPVEIIVDLFGNKKAVFPISAIKPLENKQITIKQGDSFSYPKRTYAELSHKIGGQFDGNKYVGGFSWVKPNYMKVSGDFKDHAYYIKYEGPGWESDKVAFRFYLDQRNAIDVFAKKTSGIILPHVGIDGYDSYHNPADWGMDNMKVGNALGIGTIAYWDGAKVLRVEKRDSAICCITADGKIRSQVKTTYYGWDTGKIRFNLQSLISIDAGSRASHMELFADKAIDNLSTGINKMKGIDLMIKNDKTSEWSYIATFGKQSLNNDMQGLAIFFRTKQVKEITSDNLNHVVVLKPENGYADYYFMPTWELDKEPILTEADFQRCIDEVLIRLNNPIIIK